MRNSLLIIVILLVSFSSMAQSKIKGNRNVVTNEIELDYFTKVELNDKVEIVLNQGNENKIELEADENLQDVLDVDIKEGTLVLSLNKKITSSKRFNITLFVEDLDQITLNDDSELKSTGKLEFFNLELNLSSKTDIKIENLETNFLKLLGQDRSKAAIIAKTDSISVFTKESSKIKLDAVTGGAEVHYTGNSTIEMLGKTDNLLLNGSDNAAFKSPDFVADHVVLYALDKTDTYVNAKNAIEIEAKNKAQVYLFNNPEISLKVFQDNASLHKRESMTLLESL